MKRILGLAMGVAILVAAFFIASGPADQEVSPQPQTARVFATALHETPTRVVTSVPTMTPLASGTVFRVGGVEMRLPQTYDSVLLMQEGNAIGLTDPASLTLGLNATYIADLESGFPRAIQCLRLIQVRSWQAPVDVPGAVLGSDWNTFAVDGPRVVSLGRYEAFRSIVNGIKVEDVPVTKLLYWIKESDIYWLIIFTAPADAFRAHLPAFEASMQTFSIH